MNQITERRIFVVILFSSELVNSWTQPITKVSSRLGYCYGDRILKRFTIEVCACGDDGTCPTSPHCDNDIVFGLIILSCNNR